MSLYRSHNIKGASDVRGFETHGAQAKVERKVHYNYVCYHVAVWVGLATLVYRH